MPLAAMNDGARLYYESTGSGYPLLFSHEFAGDYRSWEPQVRYFARRYRVIVYNARGYPPSDVPEDVAAYSQARAMHDIAQLLEALQVPQAHVVGLSMGGYATLHFGLNYPQMARSLVVAGCGYGSVAGDREKFQQDTAQVAQRIRSDGMPAMAAVYSKGPTRVQFEDKDPRGWQEFADQLADHSATGAALTMRGVQGQRPSVYELEAQDAAAAGADPGRHRRRGRAVPGARAVHEARDSDRRPGDRAQDRPHDQPGGAGGVHTRIVSDFLGAVESGRWQARNPASLSSSAILPARQD